MGTVPVFDPSQPHSRSFGDDAHKFPYFQNGLYFDIKGACMDIEHNRSVLKSRGIDFDIDKAVTKPKTEPPKDPGKQSTLAKTLAKKKPAEVFEMATELRTRLDADDDADDYVPAPDRIADNCAFIIRHAE
jgi:hypothetical protein